MQEFPEVDRAQWFGLDEARERILPAQAPLLDRLGEAETNGWAVQGSNLRPPACKAGALAS